MLRILPPRANNHEGMLLPLVYLEQVPVPKRKIHLIRSIQESPEGSRCMSMLLIREYEAPKRIVLLLNQAVMLRTRACLRFVPGVMLLNRVYLEHNHGLAEQKSGVSEHPEPAESLPSRGCSQKGSRPPARRSRRSNRSQAPGTPSGAGGRSPVHGGRSRG